MDVNHLDFILFSILLLIEHFLITTAFDMYIDTHIYIVISLFPISYILRIYHVVLSISHVHAHAW